MTIITSRDRVLTTLNHQEPDRVPLDLAGTHVSGISRIAYRNLREHLGMPPTEPAWQDIVQQTIIPDADIMDRFGVDTRGLFPLTSHNWDIYNKLEDGGDKWVYHDEWGMTQHFPKEHGHWFSVVAHPLTEAADVETHPWPDAGNPVRVAGLRAQAETHRAAGKVVMLKGLCAGIFEMAQRLRGMENAMIDPLIFPEHADKLYGTLADLKIAFWEMALAELGDVVDIVVENDDYGTQLSQLIAFDQYCNTIRPHLERVFKCIRAAAPQAKIFFHSCGNVRPYLPGFIEAGVDILNPVHVTAEGMEPVALKRDFGDAITFWGGGVDTQHTLPNGTPAEVREDVLRNVEALAPGGGYVFNTIHNIQPEVPPENIVAMYDALAECGAY